MSITLLALIFSVFYQVLIFPRVLIGRMKLTIIARYGIDDPYLDVIDKFRNKIYKIYDPIVFCFFIGLIANLSIFILKILNMIPISTLFFVWMNISIAFLSFNLFIILKCIKSINFKKKK